ncbi:SIMPL domain-containing protein [Gilvimarinus chinensis]|uniref:SIMPL domain-containing protein n=1 Tax=Gilvimarinus chinensis TaxID=396005 RepID=UPI000362E5F0|nr:SIMPL domain-containing protein [Gilvimarinus chinensis]
MIKLANFLLSVSLILASGSSLAQSMPDFPHISVTGEAKIEVAPDMVTLQFQISATENDANQAVDVVTQRASDIVSLVKEKGLTRKDIETWAIDKQTRRERDPASGLLKITGYEVTQRFILHINGLEKYEAIVNELLRMPNTERLNAEFDVTQRESLTRELTAKAAKDAKRRAQEMAYGLDVKISSVYAISQAGDFSQPLAKFAMSEAQYDRAGGGGRFELFAPQHITLEKHISVIFQITP